jgi:thiol:disulfide interchange protein DsbD
MDNPTASEARPRFAIALQSIPEKWTETVTARADNNSVQLVLPSEIAVSSTNIFPVDNGWIDLKRAPDIRRTSSTVTVIFQRDPQLPTPKHDPQFVIAPTPGHRPVIVTARLSGAPELLAQDSGGGNVLLILLFAFVGGLILNLMPCVFPVISLKVLSWVQQKRASTTVRIQHGLVYALGILVCFWTLVGVLLALRASGAALGWGFQLQYPPFVVALACLLFLMALILLGILPFGDAFTRVGGRLWSVEGLWGTFFSGILTTVVATPCTAPFLGTAIGFALGSTAAMAWLTFTVIALGLASPYVLLSLRPGALKYLPKPGAWMDRFKQFLAFPLFASVIWLVWVYGQQTSMNHVMHILGTLLLFGFLAWCTASYPKWRTVFVALMVLLAALQVRDAACAKKVSRAEEGMWERFDVEKIADYRKKGRPVFVDFSAAWCLTCQVNEKLVLNTSAIQAEFAKRGVIPMRADWTNNDPVITATLTSLGRNGVPVYALYPANPNAKPVLLPEVLTAAIVVRHLSNQ